MSILEDCFTKEAQITLLSVACFVSLWISILGCVWVSEHRKVIKLWDTPRRKVRGSSPCFYTSDSLGTVAPWLIARDKTTHNKCQEGAPMGSQVQFTCECSYLGEHSFWEPKFTPSLLEASVGQGLISEEAWLCKFPWRRLLLSPHIFASVFFPQFVWSLCSFNSRIF